jgi:hypothetical protein
MRPDSHIIPVIFLDIDGVLATDRQFFMSRARYHGRNPAAAELGAPYPFDPGCVDKLNEIVRSTGARIVLSSDWRLHWSLSDMGRIFRMNGLESVPYDATSELAMANLEMARAAEIGDYVQQNGLTDFVVIDDLNVGKFMAHTGEQDKFFMTRSSEGLKQVGLAGKIVRRILAFRD